LVTDWETEESRLDLRQGKKLLSIQTFSAAHPGYSPTRVREIKAVAALNLSTNLHPVPRLRIRGAIPPLSHIPSCCDNYLVLFEV
jgi:hypothetical protein